MASLSKRKRIIEQVGFTRGELGVSERRRRCVVNAFGLLVRELDTSLAFRTPGTLVGQKKRVGDHTQSAVQRKFLGRLDVEQVLFEYEHARIGTDRANKAAEEKGIQNVGRHDPD